MAVNHKDLKSLKLDATNPFFKSKYTKASTYQEAVNPVLLEVGLLMKIEFYLDNDQGCNFLTHVNRKKVGSEMVEIPQLVLGAIYTARVTLIDPESAESMEFFFSVPHDQTKENNVQGFGSANTYGLRYIYRMVFHIPSNEGDPDQEMSSSRAYSNNRIDYIKDLPWLKKGTKEWDAVLRGLSSGYTIDQVALKYRLSDEVKLDLLSNVEL